MDLFWLAGKFLLVALAVGTVAYELYTNRNRLNFAWAVWRRFRILMLFEVLAVLVLTIFSVILMWEHLPWLRYGWLNFFIEGGGNVLLAPVAEGSSSPHILIRILPPFFFVALLVALPFLAHYEEESFRRGYHEWRDIVRQSVKFGLIHLFVGIPLLVAIALMGVGFFFACKYMAALKKAVCATVWEQVRKIKKRCIDMGIEGNIRVEAPSESEDEAVMESTAYHTLYNTLLTLMLIVFAIIAI